METFYRQELFSFLHANLPKTRNGRTGNYCFPAKVVYFHHNRVEEFWVEARVEPTYPSNGELTLKQEDGLSADNLHVDFKPRFQKMTFDRESNILKIEGSSDKLGEYKVAISTC